MKNGRNDNLEYNIYMYKKIILLGFFFFTLFLLNTASVSASFSSCPNITHIWPPESPGSSWSWTVTNRSEMIRGL